VSAAVDPVLAGALRVALALLLLPAAWHKARDPARFRAALAGYGLLPERALPAAPWLLAAAELAVGAALLLPGSGAPPALAAAALLALYAGAMVAALAAGRRGIECGCGGPAGARPLGPGLVARNAVLAAAALAAALPVAPRPLVWIDALSLAGAVAAAGLLFAAAELSLDQAARGRALRRVSVVGPAPAGELVAEGREA
jgi:hypothetical protein